MIYELYLNKAVFKMQNRNGEKEKGAVSAFSALNISVGFRGWVPEATMKALA